MSLWTIENLMIFREDREPNEFMDDREPNDFMGG